MGGYHLPMRQGNRCKARRVATRLRRLKELLTAFRRLRNSDELGQFRGCAFYPPVYGPLFEPPRSPTFTFPHTGLRHKPDEARTITKKSTREDFRMADSYTRRPRGNCVRSPDNCIYRQRLGRARQQQFSS